MVDANEPGMDKFVAFDLMQDSANLLVATILRRVVRAEGPEEQREYGLKLIHQVNDRRQSVRPDDIPAVLRLSEEFTAEQQALDD